MKQADPNYEMSELPVGHDGIKLRLYRRTAPNVGGPAVLLTHGGNTNSQIYTLPKGGLAGYLHEKGWDPWLLDWRGSNWIVDPIVHEHRDPYGGSPENERRIFSLDRVAEEDIPSALKFIRDKLRDEAAPRRAAEPPLSMVSYCLSSGAASMAIARGQLEDYGVQHIVLLSLGLFFEAPWNGWIKAEDYILERTLIEKPYQRAIDPRHPELWPKSMKFAYGRWPKTWLPPPRTNEDDMLHRLSFMIGTAWATENLHPSLQGDVRRFFGAFHMGLYLHAAQNVRRGYAARFDSAERGLKPGESDLNPRWFEGKHIRIICAQNNGVWHRNSADLMFDWLGTNTKAVRSKHVALGYNLHELLWGATAHKDVYPEIARGLARA